MTSGTSSGNRILPAGISLASAWNPRGELQRLQHLLPVFQEVYRGVAITLPPGSDLGIVAAVEAYPDVQVAVTPDWSWGRHLSLEVALAFHPAHVHYADCDRLLRWVETRPEEWLETVAGIQRCDCMVIGRTEFAYRTHPRALIETEAISNLVASYLVGRDMDVSAGSRGFSRSAVQCILSNCRPGRALGADTDWLITLRRAGFDLEYVQVDGLDWESADRYQDQAADELSQSQAAEVYDANPEHWAQRVQVALEIVESGIEAVKRDLESTKDFKISNSRSSCSFVDQLQLERKMPEQLTYNHAEIEPKWQARWEAEGMYHADIDPAQPKHYALTMLPYPSGDLHIGHWYAMTPSDARARFMRMRGFNVMFPMGFDAFGLPAENAAIRRNIHPKEWTYANIARMRAQLRSMGAMFDWRREAVSSDPEYYRWTQWFFNQLLKHNLAYRKMAAVDWCPKDNTTLAREQVVGEERRCERCGTPVIKKNLEQWFFRATSYADELLDFSHLDWPERVQTLQTNWIGRSEGAEVSFPIVSGQSFVGSEVRLGLTTHNSPLITVFTTRPDTLWGATFMVLAPEHPLVEQITTPEQHGAVQAYVRQAVRQTDIQREATDKEKTGVFTGACAVNPVNGRQIPIWIADYVLLTYGTGAIMAVPAHDERDFAFALKYGMPILPVIERPDGLTKSFAPAGTMRAEFTASLDRVGIPFIEGPDGVYATIPVEKADEYIDIARRSLLPQAWNEVVGTHWVFIFADGVVEWDSPESEQAILERCKSLEQGVAGARTLMEMLWACEFYRDALYHDAYGTMIHSGHFSGAPGDRAKEVVTAWLEEQGKGKGAINYRLRDWLISRQRYWGAPIPVIHCPEHGTVPVPDEQLPILLPDDVEWLPTGESPLKLHPTWKAATCPTCGGPAERETDTMDTFMCSSWYHLRYLSPHFGQGPFDPLEYAYWMPVDTYTGGIEHATMHLIYTRFFHKACRDMGITQGPEPMLQLRNQGIILGEDAEKMSKSRGNVVSPDDLVKRYGADTVRAYLMFFARWEQGGPWNSSGIEGVVRWIRRTWALFTDPAPHGSPPAETLRALRRKVHQTLRQVTHDFETFEFNTIISALMELLNEMYRAREQGAGGTPEWQEAQDIYLRMLAPVSPHIAEELWSLLRKPYSIHQQAWPQVDQAAAAEDEITLVVQVNGKVRDRITVPAGIGDEKARALALSSEAVQKYLDGKPPRKAIVVPGKLINFVI